MPSAPDDQANARAAFHALAERRYARVLESGKAIPWAAMRAWLKARAAGKQAPRLKP